MAFKLFDDALRRITDEFMSHIGSDIVERVNQGTPIALEEYQEMRINSWEQKYLQPHLTDEAFVWHVENCLKQIPESSPLNKPCVTYDEWASREGIQELLRRFKLKDGLK